MANEVKPMTFEQWAEKMKESLSPKIDEKNFNYPPNIRDSYSNEIKEKLPIKIKHDAIKTRFNPNLSPNQPKR